MSTKIDRRRILRGAGIALSVPAFGSLTRHAIATEPRSKPRRLVCVGSHLGFWPTGFFPKQTGKNYETSLTLKPIDVHRNDFTVFSHLDHGTKGGHSGVHAFLSGVRKEEAGGYAEKNRTIDQAAAEHVGSETRFPSINAGINGGTSMCWTRSGVCIPPVDNPARLYEALFVQANQTDLGKQRLRIKHRKSDLDALRESANDLNGRLNTADRNMLDQYLTSVRDVERRLQMSKDWLDRPKPASPVDRIAGQDRKHIEEIPLFYDLIALALQTDSTRVATFELPMGFHTPELDVGSYHGLSHHGKEQGRLEQLQIVEAYLMKQFGRFLGKLKESGAFDDTMVIFGSGMGNAHKHSNRDLPIIVAGGGLEHQGHVACPEEDGKRVPLCNLYLSALHWFGANQIDRFNKSTGTFNPMKIG